MKPIERFLHYITYDTQSDEDSALTPSTPKQKRLGARLSFLGLPCPNLSTGGYHFHGVYEYIPVESLEKMTETLVNLVTGIDKIEKH